MPELFNGHVKAICIDCGSPVTFEYKTEGREFGFVDKRIAHDAEGASYTRKIYRLHKCAVCGRGGMSVVSVDSSQTGVLPALTEFYPVSVEHNSLPENIPEALISEYREAELCLANGAKRAASALVRSTLEKTLKLNGYSSGNLKSKIDLANKDGIITDSRKKRAHEEVRVLGNDVLHEDWSDIPKTEVEDSLHYAARIIEDFYDDRKTVEEILIAKKRIPDTKEGDESEEKE